MGDIFSALTVDDERRIAFVLLVILANFALAVVGAIVKGGFDPAKDGFDFQKLPEFFYKQVLPYVLGLAVFAAFLHVLPPSTLAAALVGSTPSTTVVDGLTVATPSGFAWLDPTALWTVYGAMVANLVKSLLINLAYLVGKGSEAAQAVAAKKAE